MSSTALLLHPPHPILLFPSSSSSFRPRFLSPLPSSALRSSAITCSTQTKNTRVSYSVRTQKNWVPVFLAAAAAALALVGPTTAAASAAELTLLGSSVQFHEPANALSLPTWAVHVSSVVEWVTAMALVWQFGDKSGNETWKGLSWGMVPALGGAMCACTWHFFYYAESLEVLVALQAALTVLGNATMCIAAFRIYKSQSS